MAVTASTQIDPTIQPFLSYGLGEAQRLYQAGGPQYYPGQTYVAPSETTQRGLQALEQRALMGNPLMAQAQQTLGSLLGGTVNPAMAGVQATASGQYLSGNPFFQGAFAPAAQAATQQFQSAMGNIASQASRAGRYGSGAMERLQGQASNQLAQQLANTAGQLAYGNYAAERGLQEAALGRLGALGQQDVANRMAAAAAIPQITAADYGDIQNLLSAGQLREGYQGQQLQSDINRFNFLQNAPQQNLANFLNAVYGNPLGRYGVQGMPSAPSSFQNFLGTAATIGGLYKNLGGAQGISNLWNTASNFFNPTPSFQNTSLAPFFFGTGTSGD